MKSVKEAAKEIRKVLKAEYPSCKFSVRSKSFSCGAAVDITWIDGPTEKEVTLDTNHLKGDNFVNEYIGTHRSTSRNVMVAAAKATADYNVLPVPEIIGDDYPVVDPHSHVADITHRLAWATNVYERNLTTVFVEALENELTARYIVN